MGAYAIRFLGHDKLFLLQMDEKVGLFRIDVYFCSTATCCLRGYGTSDKLGRFGERPSYL